MLNNTFGLLDLWAIMLFGDLSVLGKINGTIVGISTFWAERIEYL
jgi:hypothetical protein